MTWQRGSQKTSINKLNELTSRLIRLITYKKITECQNKLTDKGIKCDLLKNFDVSLHSKEKIQQKLYLLNVIPNNESTF